MNKKITIRVKDVLVFVLFLVFLSTSKNNYETPSVGKYSISSDCKFLYKMNNNTGEVFYWLGNKATGRWKKWGVGF